MPNFRGFKFVLGGLVLSGPHRTDQICLGNPKDILWDHRTIGGLIDHRVERLSPVPIRIVHHDVNEYGQERSQHCGAVPNLIPIYFPIPGRPAVDKLVTEHVECSM